MRSFGHKPQLAQYNLQAPVVFARGCGVVDTAVFLNPEIRGSYPNIKSIFRALFIAVIVIFKEKTKMNGKRGREWPSKRVVLVSTTSHLV